jgi:hypothetical protein
MNKYGTVLLVTVFLLAGCFRGKQNTETENSGVYDVTESVELTGYLVDVSCGASGKGMDGSDLVFSPGDHTLHCLQVCKASGFGIMTKEKGSDSYHFVEFDDRGNEIALAILDAAVEEGGGIAVKAGGTLEKNLLSVSTLERTN